MTSLLFDPSISDLESIDETGLLQVLKGYCTFCRQSSDKKILLKKDPTLVKILTAFVGDRRASIGLYTCKILLSLTENPEDAKALAQFDEFKERLANVLSLDDGCVIQPKVLRKLFVVQTRLSNAQQTKKFNPTTKKSIFGTLAESSKQLVFAFDCSLEERRNAIERECIKEQGVISICFQSISANEARCIVRCTKSVEDKAIAFAILSAGCLEMVKLFVRGDDGGTEVFEFYTSQLELEQAEWKMRKDGERSPKYLDDNQFFDAAQCIATKEQAEARQNAGGWFSSLKFW